MHVFCDAGEEGVELGLGKTVEEEVGDDEVVGGVEREGEGVGLLGVEALRGVWCDGFAALAEELEHGGADVYGVDGDVWVGCEESGSEAAVSVAED